ncbi:MAG: AAA family ATPase [Candidatus Dadabacteria bacterium]|nr:AAA family ATPase [Candidatus Dadabacteria bacterium]NIQ14859.1 AAA family ATPase [Candidatus Dadabacteria bacterium]
MPFPNEQIKNLVKSGYPFIYLVSWEERRIENNLTRIARENYGDDFKVVIWTCNSSSNLTDALDLVSQSSDPGFFIFKDIHFYINEPNVIRKLKDIYNLLIEQSGKSIFFISPNIPIPRDLEKEITVIDVGLPDLDETREIFRSILNKSEYSHLKNNITPEVEDKFIQGLLGLGMSEMELALKRVLVGKSRLDEDIIENLLEEKAQLVRKSGTLEFIRQRISIDEVGGLENVKEWLNIRSLAFSSKAKDFGLDQPKGVLVMGISGCGKSLCCKAIANIWNLALLRLDLNQVYSGTSGTPEESFRKALKTVEAAAPCVLWIDEIEAGLARSGEKTTDSPVSRIFGHFLTWMQEKDVPVFIAATANQINLLPPEILRKGRFDEIFFVTLPSLKERREIFEIHLKHRGKDPSNYDLSSLAKNTEGLSGAEIEQAVISALFESFSKEKELDDRELIIATSSIVPLSQTMREEISRLERWASDRAVKASKS